MNIKLLPLSIMVAASSMSFSAMATSDLTMEELTQRISELENKVNEGYVPAEIVSPEAEQSQSSHGFEFHGYFRAGVLASVEDDFKRAKFPASKETLGRLGIESDNHYELALQKNFETDKGKKIRIKTRAGADNHNTANNQLGANVNSSDIGIMETFVEFEGLTDTGVLWGGKRFYGKDNYVFLTDFFYTDMSGTGVGIEGIELGENKWDFAYVASDKSDDDGGRWGSDTNNIMHALHVGVDLGKFEFHTMAKYLPDNSNITGEDINGGDVVSGDYTDYGFEITGIYKLDSLWGLPGNGFSQVIAQAGVGLGSGQLLGGTETEYNAFKPGTSRGQGQAYMTQVQDGDSSYRLMTWGGYFPEDSNWNYFTTIQGQYNSFENETSEGQGDDYWVSAVVRPTYNINEYFHIKTEAGYSFSSNEENGDWTGEGQVKLTVAPTVVINTGMGPAPEIRFLATYLSDSGTNNGDDDFIVGIQADMWW
ncbi:carbohydrate porin [Vibrio sp. SS-MA-C1-2]|uniref:carbohydrate porin n=1 Tax=Vibrio sp. SS-MA-C1-2 TaxID=2908646 RepID=UPI001F19BC0B|nr:carbohydrate porin [Vibrio sp. SS-MA-C1-2]UJF18402.1 carbohydrate porin [Vibrio sp. SS-MA-C1-2]